MRQDTVQEVLRRLEADDPLGNGHVSWRARRLEGRRYSSIFVLDPDPERERGHKVGETLVLKLYRAAPGERRQKEYEDLARVYAAMGPEGGVVRPVACYAELGAVITARVAGDPLWRRIRSACRHGGDAEALAETAALCTTAGTWLRRFQACGAAAMCGQRPHHLNDPESFLAYLDERLRLLVGLRTGIEPVLRTRLLAQAASVLHTLPPSRFEEVTWSHSDFGPHNILVRGSRLTVLDFELAPQHPDFDAAYFVESVLQPAGPLVDATRVLRLARAFASGFGVSLDDPLFGLFRLRHLLCTYVSESRRGGMAQIRSWAGLLFLRRRLQRFSETMSVRARVRPSRSASGSMAPRPAA